MLSFTSIAREVIRNQRMKGLEYNYEKLVFHSKGRRKPLRDF